MLARAPFTIVRKPLELDSTLKSSLAITQKYKLILREINVVEAFLSR